MFDWFDCCVAYFNYVFYWLCYVSYLCCLVIVAGVYVILHWLCFGLILVYWCLVLAADGLLSFSLNCYFVRVWYEVCELGYVIWLFVVWLLCLTWVCWSILCGIGCLYGFDTCVCLSFEHLLWYLFWGVVISCLCWLFVVVRLLCSFGFDDCWSCFSLWFGVACLIGYFALVLWFTVFICCCIRDDRCALWVLIWLCLDLVSLYLGLCTYGAWNLVYLWF